MRIITLNEQEFDNYAKQHKYNSYYQSSNYAEFEKKQNGFNIHYLGFEDNGTLIGATMLVYKELFWGYKYAYAPRGFLIDYADIGLTTNITIALKQLLKKQKFIFIKIDPPVIACERDMEGKSLYQSESVNDILNNFKNNKYEHLGFNIYNESLLARFNVFAKLDENIKGMYDTFDKKRQEEIKHGSKVAMQVTIDESGNIEDFFDLTKKGFGSKGLNFYKNLYDSFKNTDQIKIFYNILDTQKFTDQANKLYDNELQKNEGLKKIIESGDSVKYNMTKVIDDKVESDKALGILKKDINVSIDYLKKYPQGIILGVALVIEQTNGVNLLVNYSAPEFKNLNQSPFMTYQIMKHYAELGYKYINLGSIPGNFSKESKYYGAIETKAGYNSSVIEYIGEFNLIINDFMYKIYKRKDRNSK